MIGAAVVRTVDGNPEVVAEHGEAPHSRVEADAAADIDDDTALLLRGRVLDAGDRALLTAFAGHARVLRERRRGPAGTDRGGGPGRGQPDPDRAAGRGVPRPAQPAGRDQGRRLQPAEHRRRLECRRRSRAAGHHRGVGRPAGQPGRQPAGHEPAADRADHPAAGRGGPRRNWYARAVRPLGGQDRSGSSSSTNCRLRWPTPVCWSGWWPTWWRTRSSTPRHVTDRDPGLHLHRAGAAAGLAPGGRPRRRHSRRSPGRTRSRRSSGWVTCPTGRGWGWGWRSPAVWPRRWAAR